MAMAREAAQAIINKAAGEVERIRNLYVDGRWTNEQEASERLTRLKDEWEAHLKVKAKGSWVDSPAELIMRQAAAELSVLRRNSRPTARWSSVLYQVHGTLTMHEA